MRSRVSEELIEDINAPLLVVTRNLSPQHPCPGHQQDRAQDSSQPEYGNARAQMRTQHSAGNRADQQGGDQVGIDVARPPVQQAGDAGQNHGVGNVGADHDFGHERIKQEKQHHNDAARPDRCDAHQKSSDQSDDAHAGKRFHSGLPLGQMFFNPSLEQEQRRNQYQQQPDRRFDEVVDAVAIDVAQVHQKSYAQVRAGNAAERHRQHNLLPHRAFAQVHDAGRNLGEKVEQRVATHGNDGGYTQAEDKHGQQQNAATQTRQPDQRPYDEADQHFEEQEFHAVFFSSQIPVLSKAKAS